MATEDRIAPGVRVGLTIARLELAYVGPGLVVSVLDARGLRGVGEASPLRGYSSESLDDCLRALSSIPPATLTLSERAPLLDQIARHLRPLAHQPAAAFGLETALLDLCGRITGEPLHRLLAPGRPARPLALNALVETPAQAAAAVDQGFACLKVKLGRREATVELANARAMRKRVGDEIALRFDANRRWGAAEAEARLRALSALVPEYVEEPTASTAELASPPVPVALDESLADGPVDLERCARSANVRAVVLKPMRLGGAIRCLSIAREARDAGIQPVVTHMMDGPIAHAATTELAFALAPTLACGLAAHRGLAQWPLGPATQIRTAMAVPGDGPGHGVDVP